MRDIALIKISSCWVTLYTIVWDWEWMLSMCQLLQPTSGVWVPARHAPCVPPPPPNCLRKLGCAGREEPLVLPTAVGTTSSLCSHVGTGSISQSRSITYLTCNSHCPAQKCVCVQAAMGEGRGRCWGRDWEKEGNHGEDHSCPMK